MLVEALHYRLQGKLLLDSQVPSGFREMGIKFGYRKPGLSANDCVNSAFFLNNETINFWTHFVPFLYFFYILISFWIEPDFRHDSYNWAFVAYCCTVCGYPLLSSLAHLFSYMSETVRHVCYFGDYLGISWYSIGVGVVYHAYCFDSLFFHTLYSQCYLYICAAAAVFSTVLACSTRFVPRHSFRKVGRVVAFAVPYVLVNLPLLERVIHCRWENCADPSIPGHMNQFLWMALDVLIYSTHFPERIAPGMFDFFGHSHQLHHICGAMATYSQLWASYTDLQMRRTLMRDNDSLPWGKIDASVVIGVLIIDCLILAYFSRRAIKDRSEPSRGMGPETNNNEPYCKR